MLGRPEVCFSFVLGWKGEGRLEGPCMIWSLRIWNDWWLGERFGWWWWWERGGVLKVWYNGMKRGSGYKPRERTCKFVFFSIKCHNTYKTCHKWNIVSFVAIDFISKFEQITQNSGSFIREHEGLPRAALSGSIQWAPVDGREGQASTRPRPCQTAAAPQQRPSVKHVWWGSRQGGLCGGDEGETFKYCNKTNFHNLRLLRLDIV